jgi:hypothetical protein
MIHERYTIDRALVLVPMGALVAAFGVDWCLLPRHRFLEWAGWAVRAGLAV